MDNKYEATKLADVTENGMLTGITEITYTDGFTLRYRQQVGFVSGCWIGVKKVWKFEDGQFGRDDMREATLPAAMRKVYEMSIAEVK